MTESLIIALVLLLCGAVAYLRPQTRSTMRGKSPRRNPDIDWRAVRRTGGAGMMLLGVVIGGGSWLLVQAGTSGETLAAVRLGALFVGAIAVIAAVETRKNRKR